MPKLYIVATPIGNLEDISLRALRVLKDSTLIAAEDTRTTKKLLVRYNIETPLTSFHEHNQARRTPQIIESLKYGDVVLVSDAGVPVISDPGRQLIRKALDLKIPVSPIPGPSAITSALSVSGMNANKFIFTGFLPKRKTDRQKVLKEMRTSDATILIFESPHRLRDSLNDLLNILGDRKITICRELTKKYEEILFTTISKALAHYDAPRGEFTLVVEGCPIKKDVWDDNRTKTSLSNLKEQGFKAREAVATVTQASGLPKRHVYKQWLSIDG